MNEPKYINNKAWPVVISDRSGSRVRLNPQQVVQGAYFAKFVNPRKGIIPYNGPKAPSLIDVDAGVKQVAKAAVDTQIAAESTLNQNTVLINENERLRKELDATRAAAQANSDAMKDLQRRLLSLEQNGVASSPVVEENEDDEEELDETAEYNGKTLAEWREIAANGKLGDAVTNSGDTVGLAKFLGMTDQEIAAAGKRKAVLAILKNKLTGE